MSSPNPAPSAPAASASPPPSSPQETPQTPPAPPVVTPEAESRLDQLTARYQTAKALADQAKDELEEITSGIKAELQKLRPTATEIVLSSPHLTSPLSLKAVTSWRLDAKRIKATYPQVYAAFAKRITSWRLEAM